MRNSSWYLFIIVFTALLYQNSTIAQNPLWTLPPNHYDHINLNQYGLANPTPGFQDYSSQPSNFVHNMMPDADGNPLFFAVDGKFYDGQGYYIDDMINSLGQSVLGTSEMVMIPDPAACNSYYVFAASPDALGSFSDQRPYYAHINMDEPGANSAPLGLFTLFGSGNSVDMSVMAPGFFNPTTSGGKTYNVFFAATPKRADNSYLLFVSNNVGFYRFKIDDTGVHYDNYYYDFPDPAGEGSLRSEMEVIPVTVSGQDGYYLACPSGRIGGGSVVYTAILDANGNVVTTGSPATPLEKIIEFQDRDVYGIEWYFLPGRPLLYISHQMQPGDAPIDLIEFNNTFLTGFTHHALNHIPADYYNSFIELKKIAGQLDQLFMVKSDEVLRISQMAPPSASTNTITGSPIAYNLSNQGFGAFDPQYWAYTLPDQIDYVEKAGHTDFLDMSFFSNHECCARYNEYDAVNYLVNTSSTWQPGATNNPFSSVTGEVTVRDELRIPAGVNITLKNMTIKFAPGARLVLENGVAFNTGAKLTLDNTTLTVDDRCAPGSLMWEGVKVLGSPFQAQGTATTGPQAWLMLTNNSVIEHALTGASAVPSVTGYTGNKAGGVIQAKNSTFYNNVTDVEITNYGSLSSTQKSRFVRTAFVTGATLNNGDASIKNHVVLNSVQGVRFAGCTFENQLTGYDILLSGTGIFATNSRFYAEPACSIGCTTTYPTVFKNLKSGIRAYTSNGLHTATIRGCVFESNISGALLSGLQFATVIKNDFKVFVPNIPLGQGYGLYLNGCTGYQVEDNDFEEYMYSTLPAGNNTYGIIVNNSGTDDNFIYRNRMNHLKIGGQSQGTNARPYSFSLPSAGITGLQWRCNEFSGDMYQADLAVTSGYIDYEQGDLLLPISSLAESALAGNTFSHSLNDPQNDIAVNSNVEPFHYYHHSNVSQTPLYFSTTSVFPATNGLGYLSTSCRSRLRSFVVTTEIPQIENEIASIDFQTDSLRLKVDCGDSRDLMIFITGTHSAGSKKNRLLQCSPYLSDEVLTAYILSNPPAGHLSQVILANSPLSNTVADVLNAQSLPAGIAGNIQNAQTGISPMMYLNNEIGYLQKERWLLVDDMIRMYLNDSTFADPLREIELILNRERRLRRQEQLCDTRICLGDSTQAVLVKDSLQNTEGYYNYIRLAEVHLAAVNGCVCEAVRTDSTLRSKVEYVAADVNDPVMAVRGEALLTAAFDTVFTEIVEELNPVGAGRNYIPMPETEQPSVSGFSVYPNPAQNQINLSISELSASETDSQNHYTFTDAAGRTVLSGTFTGNKATLDVTQLSAGVYTVTIRGNSAVHSVVAVIR